MELHDKTALVTGGAVRIGRAIALELARHGCHVIIHYAHSEKEAAATCCDIKALGVTATAIQCDQRSVANIQRSIAETVANHSSIDLFVNNAAIFYPTPLGEVTETQWEAFFSTNLKGPFFYAQAIAKHMAKGGCIINIGDLYGISPSARYIPYGITKAGIIAMTKGLAKELAPEIRVNCICPGSMDRPDTLSQDDHEEFSARILLQKSGSHDDIAKAVAYLAQADYITGEIHFVTGGKRVE